MKANQGQRRIMSFFRISGSSYLHRTMCMVLAVTLGCLLWLPNPQLATGGNVIHLLTRAPKVIKPRVLRTKFLTKDVAELSGQARARQKQADKDRTADARQGPAYYSVMSVEFQNKVARAKFKVPGASVFTVYDRFADMYVKAAQDPASGDIVADKVVRRKVENAPGVKMVEFTGVVFAPPPPRGTPDLPTKAIPDPIIRKGIAGLTGKGVVVVIVDSGVDFRNPDFITYDAQGRPMSRLLYLWDTTSDAYETMKLGLKAPVAYPNGASVGTLYTREQLTEELRSSSKKIPATDLEGHGTACASIAAGNGNNAAKENGGKGRPEVVGVAPDADIIAVRVDEGDDSNGFENSYLLNAAVGWLDSEPKVKNRPVVVSCSFGGQYGGRDGQSVTERQLTARFPPTRVGRALVISAGNEGDYKIHSELKFGGQKDKHLVTWDTGQRGAYLEMYFDTANYNDIRFVSTGISDYTDDGGRINPVTGQYSTSGYVTPGSGSLSFYTLSGKPVSVDLYIGGGIFSGQSISYKKLIGAPGTAAGAITVGSYDWNDTFNGRSIKDVCQTGTNVDLIIGGISCYSSIGYSRNGQIKPEIVAPGQIYYASYAKDYSSNAAGEGVNQRVYKTYDLIDNSGNYIHFNGTSAATPYVAGVIALMMQQKPSITWGAIRNLFEKNAAHDRHTTEEKPNIWWGYGKLNMAAAEAMLNSLR